MKKIVSILLSLLLLFSVIPIGTFAADKAKLTLETVSAQPGETVEVAVNLENNPGIVSANLKLAFDEGLMLVDAENGDVFPSSISFIRPKQLDDGGKIKDGCRFVWNGFDIDDSLIKDGTMMKLTFEVSEEAKTGDTYNISVTTEDGDVIDKYLNSVILTADSNVEVKATDEAKLTLETVSAQPGETVEVQFKIQNAPKLKSFSITGLTYDTSKLQFGKAVCNVEGVAISQVLPNGNAVVALNSNTDINGLIFTYTFTIKEDVEDCSIPISCTFAAKEKPEGGIEQAVPFSVVPGEVVVKNYVTGDLNGDDVVDSDDSIYLLWYTYLPEDYPINQNADFNGDGNVDSDDSIYLLWHTYLPEDYPLN